MDIKQRANIFTVLVGGVLLAGGLGFWTVAQHSKTRNHASSLSVDPAQLDFGEIWEHDSFPWVFTVTNPSDADVRIIGFQTTCNCVSIEPQSLLLPPRGSAQVNLIVNLASVSSAPRTDFSTTVAPVIKDRLGERTSESWRFTGIVHRPFALSKSFVDLGGAQQIVKGSPIEPVIVSVESLVPCQQIFATCESQWATVRVHQIRDQAGAFRLEIFPNEKLRVGSFNFTVYLTALLKSGEKRGRVPVYVQGEVVNDVDAFPRSIDIGVVPLGAHISRKVTLKSYRDMHFRIADAEVTGNATLLPTSLELCPSNQDIGAACRKTFIVRKRFDTLGTCSGMLTFSVDQHNNEHVTLLVPYTAYVVAGIVE